MQAERQARTARRARTERPERIRRARREDIAALLGVAGGPEPGRVRALSRLTKTLAADVYVLERAAEVRGVVAVAYRRSLARGGLVATIDALQALPPAAGTGSRATDPDATAPGEPEEQSRRDAEALLELALTRARRRGCVAIDAAPPSPHLRAALEARGFVAAAVQLVHSLRAPAAGGNEPEGRE